MSIRNTNLRPLWSLTLIVSLVRFLVMPVLFFLGIGLLLPRIAISPAQWWVIFLEIHIPPATNLSVMAAQAGMNEDQVAFVILITYLAYLVLFPIYLTLFLSLPGIL
jgi:malate permease and related proteins